MTQPRSILDLRVRVESLRDREEDIAFALPEASFGALVKVIGVDRVLSCEAELHLVPDGAAVDVTGFVRARVVQTCIVSLEPFETTVDEPIDVAKESRRQRYVVASEIRAGV